METRILIVDDDPFICRQLEELYSSQQYAVSSAPNAPEALRLLQEHEFSLAVVDLKIPGTDGIGLTREIRDRWPDLDVIMITGYASIKGAVEAIKQGASDYITKPFQKEEILLATEKILEKRRLLDEISYLRSQLSDRYSFANMVSRNRVMHEIFETIGVLAQNDATVLIYGESGTGKELAARAIHFQGKRKGGRFVAINCAAFPDTLLESELFGYERGAFTGAVHDRVGKIELSTAGTLFLDEIESISLNMQLKLLRVLEEREVEKPGPSAAGKEAANGNGRHTNYDYEVPLKEYLRRAERDYLARVLRKYRGGINLSAKHALVDAATLHRKMKLHGLRREEYRLRGKAEGPEALASGS